MKRLPWCGSVDRMTQGFRKRLIRLDSVRDGSQDNHTEIEPREVLLMRDPLIGRHEDIELVAGTPKELSVVDRGPAALLYSHHFVRIEELLDPSMDGFIKQDAQAPSEQPRQRAR